MPFCSNPLGTRIRQEGTPLTLQPSDGFRELLKVSGGFDCVFLDDYLPYLISGEEMVKANYFAGSIGSSLGPDRIEGVMIPWDGSRTTWFGVVEWAFVCCCVFQEDPEPWKPVLGSFNYAHKLPYPEIGGVEVVCRRRGDRIGYWNCPEFASVGFVSEPLLDKVLAEGTGVVIEQLNANIKGKNRYCYLSRVDDDQALKVDPLNEEVAKLRLENPQNTLFSLVFVKMTS